MKTIATLNNALLPLLNITCYCWVSLEERNFPECARQRTKKMFRWTPTFTFVKQSEILNHLESISIRQVHSIRVQLKNRKINHVWDMNRKDCRTSLEKFFIILARIRTERIEIAWEKRSAAHYSVCLLN